MTIADELAQALGSAYRLEGELGGGGMSHVFTAVEVALGRRVVVKVLPPELAAGVSLDRFRREIQVLAALQHPLIVPLLSAGEGRGLFWYVMPFVEGESLRAREVRDGKLPAVESARVLRDVAEALAYAHARGLVHRDIKPENILLTAGRAVLADFGVAKALSDAAANSAAGLTGMGLALGTPVYMSPEQAAADPDTDARADLYSLGCVAYELLGGRPPFVGLPPAQLLAAHVTTPPTPLERFAPDAPPALISLIMRCLAKRPADRPASAAVIAQELDRVATPTGGTMATTAVAPFGETLRRIGLPAVVGIYVVIAALVCVAVRFAMLQLGLPDWILTAAFAFSAIGLVAVVVSAIGSRSRVSTRTATFAGVGVLLLLPAAAGAHALLRSSGVGPMGSLMGAGKLRERDRILIADFANTTPDTVLGTVVTEAFRTDFTQSRAVSVVGREAVAGVLERMQRPRDSRLDAALSREVAVRDGIKAIIEGDVAKLGTQYVLSARLVAPQGGDVLAAFRETASGDAELIGAIDKLSKELREKIGESLQTIRASGGLERVTTTSLEALRRYTEAIRVGDSPDPGARVRELALLREAVQLDSTFAMAWRRLGSRLGSGFDPDRVAAVDAVARAYRLRERLSPIERALTEASYYDNVTVDHARSLEALQRALEIDPYNRIALNNAALTVSQTLSSDSLQVDYASRLLAIDSTAMQGYTWLVDAYYRMGRPEQAKQVAQAFTGRFGITQQTAFQTAHWLAYDRQYDSASALLQRMLASGDSRGQERIGLLSQLASLARVRGHLADADRYDADAQRDATDSLSQLKAPLLQLSQRIQTLAWTRDDPAAARAVLQRGVKEHPPDRLPLAMRATYYDQEAFSWALAGDPVRARQALASYQRLGAGLSPELHLRFAADSAETVNADDAWIALAAGQPERAIATIRPLATPENLGFVAALGLFYSAAHQPDSAIAVLERFTNARGTNRVWFEAFYLPRVYQELGAQYEALSNREKAAAAYQAFIDLWRTADPELQPQLKRAREALARVSGEGGLKQ